MEETFQHDNQALLWSYLILAQANGWLGYHDSAQATANKHKEDIETQWQIIVSNTPWENQRIERIESTEICSPLPLV